MGLDVIMRDARSCRLCEEVLPLGPRPLIQGSEGSRVLVISRAPGAVAHETGVPWNDRSGVPHPSPRNGLWLRKSPWFQSEAVPPCRSGPAGCWRGGQAARGPTRVARPRSRRTRARSGGRRRPPKSRAP